MSRVVQQILDAELEPVKDFYAHMHDCGVHDRVRHRKPIAIPPVVAQQQAKNRVKRKRPRKKSDPDPAAPKIIIGVDSEWVEPFAGSVYPEHKTGRNLMLSAQFLMLYQGKQFTPHIYYTRPARLLRDDLGDPDDAGRRWPLHDVLYEYIRDAVKAGFLSEWPDSVYLAGHWTRADLPGFADYGRIRKKLDGVRKTYVSLGKPLSIGRKEGGRWQGFKTWLIDTFLLAPGNSRGLDKVARLYGMEKAPLPPGAIQRMDLLLRDDRERYDEYAIQDARIAAHHAAAVAEFAKQESGPGKIPVTLSALGVNILLSRWQDRGLDRLYLTGQMRQKIPGRRGRPEIVKILGFERFETLAINSYVGGRNEAAKYGPTEIAPDDNPYCERDLKSAYVTALASVRMPDWDASYATTDPAAFTADALGFAELEFEFPASCRFPGLAVRAGDRGLIFPRKGRTFATAPEIATALWLGAKITILHGAIVPWQNNDMRPFAPVLCEWINRRAEHKKDTLQNEMFKLLGNSLYGKVGQGLSDSKAFNTRKEEYQPIGHSKITNAYFAAYVTGLVRAVLAELAALADGQIISMTTDALLMRGVLRSAPGPSSEVMASARVVLSGDPELLEVKGRILQLLSFRTRGVLTLQPLDRFIKIARGGMKAPEGIWSPHLSSAENEARENAWFIEHLLFRHPGDRWIVRHPSSFSTMHRNSDDHRYIDDLRKANFEYDFKRRPVNVRPAYVRIERGDDLVLIQHIAFSTEPWNTVEEFNTCRDAFERWRHGDPRRSVPGRVLKTIRDWRDFVAFWQGAVPSAAGISRSSKGPLDQARRLFIRLYVAGLAGLPGSGYEAAAKMLTEAGYPTQSQDFKDAKRRTKALPDRGVIPAEAEGVTAFVAAVQRLWPSFDAARLLQRPDDPGT